MPRKTVRGTAVELAENSTGFSANGMSQYSRIAARGTPRGIKPTSLLKLIHKTEKEIERLDNKIGRKPADVAKFVAIREHIKIRLDRLRLELSKTSQFPNAAE